MADLNELQSSETVKIVGSDSNGGEQNAVGSTGLSELKVTDRINQQGEDVQITVTTTAQIARVGGSNKTDRNYVFLQAIQNQVKWGFDANCRFDAFRNQLIVIPASEDCDIYIKANSGSRNIVVGEG